MKKFRLTYECKKILKKAIIRLYSICNSNLLWCKIYNYATNNKINIGELTRLNNCKFILKGDNNIIRIGSNCNINGLNILMQGDNNEIIIGNKVFINGSKYQPVIINACEGKSIQIGNDCIFSNNIEIHTTDYHTICDYNMNRINLARDIVIGNHCWIGLQTTILKGSVLPDNTIVGAGSILTGTYSETNTIIVGSPTRIIKKNIYWDIRLL